MDSPGRIGPGLLADIEQLEQEVRQAQRAIDETTGTAEAADELILATVTGRGELVRLDLDPRVYREFAPDALAEEVITAVNEARSRAQRNALEILTTALPTLPAPTDDDPAFGPLLAELERMREVRPAPGGGPR
jgi:DNA-binding protein YbaB